MNEFKVSHPHKGSSIFKHYQPNRIKPIRVGNLRVIHSNQRHLHLRSVCKVLKLPDSDVTHENRTVAEKNQGALLPSRQIRIAYDNSARCTADKSTASAKTVDGR